MDTPRTPAATTIRSGRPVVQVASIAPVVLPAPQRAAELQLRVTAPATDGPLPVILLSHGLGASNNLSSLNGYAPLVTQWAQQGFAVIQPTHLDSKTFHRAPGDPETARAWRTRAEDMSFIIDHLDDIEDAVPHLRGRLDRERIAVAGHSMGGHTAGLLLGTQLDDPQDGSRVDLRDTRIRAGVVLAAPGRGGDVLTPFAASHLPFFETTDFSTMTAPAIVVVGDEDTSEVLNTEGPTWLTDPYRLSNGPKVLVTMFGAGHILGGISGYDTAEATDENPTRVTAVATLTAAYLLTQLGLKGDAWPTAQQQFASRAEPLGTIQQKG
ncbi:chlorophyllase [Curtobacterium sp. MCPF17_011]|uniref:alpha/beta hydrolase family protein n=1 Tax=Curtobacterium sp. MCPF17_011 TaxID=2175652 RepID=UPI000DA7C16D|nr:alpha/beta fold hydrolase [Curtobacterium sp. MCPF17_011]PZF09977.1 chlorophyllase [Curtobacterium sp. MCPF17_011]